MLIEDVPLQLVSNNIDQIKVTGVLFGLNQNVKLKLQPNQLEMLQLMTKSKTIYEIGHHFIQKQTLVSFHALRELIEFLAREDFFANPAFKQYFKDEDVVPTSYFEDLFNRITGREEVIDLRKEMSQIAFFRSLDPSLFNVFLNNSKVVQTPSQISVCQEGQSQRSLFALIRGEAHVYKKTDSGKRKRVATLSQGSIFGETGFLFGEPRTADVVTSKESIIVRYKYLPEIFDQAIKSEVAQVLQKRFWLVHALLKSEMFKTLPDDCFDSLLFAGKFKTMSAVTVICQEGSYGDSCFLVVQGSLNVSQNGKSIRTLSQGDCFGEIALLLNQGKRTATVSTRAEVVVLEIRAKDFYELLFKNLWLACEFESLALSRWQGINH